MGACKRIIKTTGLLLVGCALGQELAKPPEDRTWRGRVAGFIPYDFRLPTLERLREAYWNPDEPRLCTDRVFGVGWAVNFYWLFQWLLAAWGALQGPRAD